MYRCDKCGYLYNPESGDSSQSISPDTPFENLPKSWMCPRCGSSKEGFKKYDCKTPGRKNKCQ